MKAEPDDLVSFEHFLTRLAQFGNGQSREEAAFAETILQHFHAVRLGFFGRKCACGRDGVAVRTVCIPKSSSENHVVCKTHAKAIDDYDAYMVEAMTGKDSHQSC